MSLRLLSTSTSTGLEPSLISPAVMDNLATRLRPNGLFLLLLRPDGSVAYYDAAASMFYQRYVLPLVQQGDPVDGDLRQRLAALTPQSTVSIWSVFPGIQLAVFPFVEKRQMTGVVMLAGKSSGFRLGDDVVRVCGRFGLDGIWLNQQADELPGYSEDHLQRKTRLLLTMMRDQVRLGALEHELNSLSTQLANTYEELSLIYQISSGMRINRGTGDFFKQACLDVLEVMQVQAMGVALCGEQAARQPPTTYGPLVLPAEIVRQLADALVPVLCQRKTPVLINDLAHDKTMNWLSPYAHQVLAVPLQRQEQVLGCLFALDKSDGDFDSQDSKLLTSIANESAIYLENAVLYDDVHGLMMGLLHSLTSAVDAKDAYTCGHSERVAALSRKLAMEAGLPDSLADRVYMAGLLHDVGKIGVPESVLQKTGKLTPEEFEQMKRHPQIGARILRDIKQIKDLIPGVLHHHERYDGQGYPARLAGDNIPLLGRLICLADGFDAMTSSRTYRKALPLEVALTEIRRCSGTQFDPVLAEAFLRLGHDQFRDILREDHSGAAEMIELQKSLRSQQAA